MKKERELAISLTEVLHTLVVTSTVTFPAPSPVLEKAVGSERFEHANVQAHLTVPKEESKAGEEMDILLDLVNVGKNFGLLVRLDNVVPPSSKITNLIPPLNVNNGSIDLRGKKLEPMKIESIKMSLQVREADVINFSPHLVYVDDIGRFQTCAPEEVTITVHSQITFEFKTKESEKAFSFLVKSFVDDYMKRSISLEKSGWRTLMDIVKGGKISRSSVYGVRGRQGKTMSELERRGLVETRIFPGERGRGGSILRARIPYSKEPIKRYIDERVMKNAEK